MIEANQYYTLKQPRMLVIAEDDKLPENDKYFYMKRYYIVFIHENNKFINEFKLMLRQCVQVMDYEFGKIYTYK